MTTSTKSSTESIALRAFNVLEYIVRAESPLTLDEITRGCDLPKPTTFRILDMLRDANMLQRDPEGKRYAVGPRLSQFALDVVQHSVQRAECHHVLVDLVNEVGETCNITMLDGNQVLYVDRYETTRPLRLSLQPGTRVPLHCTASGKLFLSQMAPRQVQRMLGAGPLPRYTAKTITDVAVLMEELKVIRKTGIGTYDSEYFDDSVSIAVPIGAHNKRVHMALALHGPSSRISLELCFDKYLQPLREAADQMSRILVPDYERAKRGGQAQSAD